MPDPEQYSHITLVGPARGGNYRIEEELPDGRLLICPEPAPPVDREGLMGTEEFNASLAEHGPNIGHTATVLPC